MRNHSYSWVASILRFNLQPPSLTTRLSLPPLMSRFWSHCAYVSVWKRLLCVDQTVCGLWAQFTAKVMRRVERESKQSSSCWTHGCHACGPWYPHMYTNTVSLYHSLFLHSGFKSEVPEMAQYPPCGSIKTSKINFWMYAVSLAQWSHSQCWYFNTHYTTCLS